MSQSDTVSTAAHREDKGNLPAYLVLAVSLSLTLLGWNFISENVRKANDTAFKNRAVHTQMMIWDRLDIHENALKEVQNLISIMGFIPHEQWNAYIEGLGLSKWRPGLVAVSLAKREWNPDGSDRYPILYVNGFVEDGYFKKGDNLAGPPWSREQVEKAISENILLFSDIKKVTLAGGEETRGYHLYFIVAKDVKRLVTPAERRAKTEGIVAGFITMDGIFSGGGHMETLTMPGIGVEVYDGAAQDPSRLVGRYGVKPADMPSKPAYEHVVVEEFGGRKFILRFFSTKSYQPDRSDSEAWMALGGGALVGFLLFGITLTLTHTRSHAYTLAEKMTAAFFESETKYRMLFSKGIDAIYIFDIETMRIEEANDAFLNLFGYSREEAAALRVEDVCAEHGLLRDIVPRVMERGEAFFPLRYQRKKNGAVFPVELAAAAFTWKGRRMMFALARDISERLKAEEEIRNLKNFYSTILETVLTGVMVTGPDGVVRFANKAMGNIAGVPVENIVGLDITKGLDSESRAGFLPIYSQAARSLWPAYYDGLRISAEGWRKLWLSGWIAPIIKDGVFDGVIITAEDITEKKLAQEALKESEERLKTLTEVAEEGIAISENGVLLDVNPTLARMYGYRPAEMIGRKILEFVDKESKDYVLDLLSRDWDKPYEAVMVKKDGSRFPAEVIGKYGIYHGKRVRVASIRDITERRKTEDELYKAKEKAEMATRLKDKFVSLVAHDLRSPFTSILGMLALLEAETDPPLHPSHREVVRRIQDMGEHLVTMISNLLSISRLQTGKITPRKRFLDGQMVAGSVIAGMGHLAAQKGVKVVNGVSAGHRLYADPDLLQEALRNLLSNAIKFSKSGDVVTVFAPPGDKAALAVRDTGVGIRRELLPNLFRHEEKTSTVGTAGEMGTGLGLPLTHDIIDAHGGSVMVDSEEGSGSVFTIVLPFARPLVLVVDDEPEMRLLMRMRLEALDADVAEAGSVDSAISILRSREVNLVITDIFMPVKDGFELLIQIRRMRGRDIPVLVVTSDSRMETRERAFRLGADDFVNKPVIPSDVIPRARRLLMGGL